MKDVFEKTGLDSLSGPEELGCHIWNCDETGFCTAIAAKRILARRGAKDVQDTIGGSGRDYITVLGAGSADDTRLPPYIVYKGKTYGLGRCREGRLLPCTPCLIVGGWKRQFPAMV